MASEPADTAEAAPPITVNLARHPLMLFIGLGLLIVVVLSSVALYLDNPESVPPYLGGPVPGLIGGVIGGCLGAGAMPYILGPLLTYDPRTRTIRARDQLSGFRRTYPRKGFRRLEYAADSGRLYEIRTNGKRRRIRVSRGAADREEWRSFVEQFQADHPPLCTERPS